MKRYLTFFAVMLLASFVLAGCGESTAIDPDARSIVIGGGQFPECLVGVWQSGNWAFKFEPDGSIIKMKHHLVRHVDLEYPVVELKGPKEGTFALFVMGECKTIYNPKTRNLDVRVFLENYLIQLVNGTLVGNAEDHFTGKVSKDCKTWTAQRRNYGYLEGATLPDRDLIDANPDTVIFKKVDMEKIKKEIEG